jgi:hypothetical protein
MFAPIPRHGLDLHQHTPWCAFVVNDLMGELVHRFVDIGGIVDHHCLNFVFVLS